MVTSNRLRTKDRLDLKLSRPEIECCGVELITTSDPIIALSVYRPPNTNPTNFIAQFNALVHKIKQNKGVPLVIRLDHNLDFLKSSTHTPTHQFIDEILDLGLIPTITRPTRITHHRATLIDNILLDQRYCELYKSSLIVDKISDHLPCLTTLCGITVLRNYDKTVISRDLQKQNLASLQQNLINCNWNMIIKDGNTCDKFTRFHTHLSGVIDNFCPMVERNLKYNQIRCEPWLTPGLFISIKKCKKLYK